MREVCPTRVLFILGLMASDLGFRAYGGIHEQCNPKNTSRIFNDTFIRISLEVIDTSTTIPMNAIC